MEPDPSTSLIIILILLYFISTFFSIIKIVFSSTDINALPADNERLHYIASKIEEIVKNKPKLTITVSIGKTIANISFSIIAFQLFTYYFSNFSLLGSIAATVGISSVILTIFAYTIPRALALHYHYKLISLSYILYSVFAAFFSLISVTLLGIHKLILKLLRFDEKLAFLSEDEKSRLNEIGDHEEPLDKDEKEMIRGILELGETTVKEIMVPRVDLKALNIDTDYQKALETIREAGHSRIPVYKENSDTIVGILYAKDILGWLSKNPRENWDLESLIKEPIFVPTSKKIDDLMREMKKNHIHIVIVVDEYGGTAGIVTMEDILEVIVGEIQDEYDLEEEPVVCVNENVYHVEPHIELDDLVEKIGVHYDLSSEDYNTLGGLVYHEYGDFPKENTEFEFKGLRLKIIKMKNQRIEKVEVEVLRHKNNVKVENSF